MNVKSLSINFIYKKPKIINYLAATAVCLYPILGQYKFYGPLSIGDIYMLIIAAIAIFKSKNIVIWMPLICILTFHSFLSLICYFTLRFNDGILSMFSSIIMAFVSCIILMQLVPFYEKKSFLKVISILAFICGLIILYQFIVINSGGVPYNGRLFEDLAKGYTWSASVTYRRPNSLFSEPSYFAIFYLPFMALMLINKKYCIATCAAILLFISTSSLGIAGSFVILILYMILEKRYKEVCVVLIVFSILVLIIYYGQFQWLINLNVNKIGTINSKSQIRIWGYIEYFSIMPLVNQLIGVGFNQLSNYFVQYGLYNYSNAFVLVLLNYGVIGLIGYLFFLIKVFFGSELNGKIFLGIFVLISMFDSFLYNTLFYYGIWYVIIFSKIPLLKINLVTSSAKKVKDKESAFHSVKEFKGI